ncbi:MAG: anti-sigma factor [Pseudomonadota bacterium]
MSFDREKLSGFLDGELSSEETREIELALESDPTLAAELEQLMAADSFAKQEFEEMLSEPVPLGLAAAVRNAPIEPSAPMASNNNRVQLRNRQAPWWSAVAAALALVIGSAGGYFTGLNTQPQIIAAAPGWLTDIADYHRVYSAQGRHLVEVDASESDHIETWLTNTVGADVVIPDLESHGLNFRGGRLLVAAGKPVAQMMYTDAAGQVVALCLIANPEPDDVFRSRQIGGFDMVTWGGGDANFVLVSDRGRDDLEAVARTAASSV